MNEDPIFSALYTYTRALSVALGYRDPLTQMHSERVRDLAAAIGAGYGLSADELVVLGIAASFHDIGKIGVPDRILLKASAFDASEWKEIRQHAEIGERIMAATEVEGSRQAARVIRHHHEYYDGSGYPDGLAGEDIPICSRIIAIADSYDAMAVTRSYHQARTHREIMAVMDVENGKKHDPDLMRTFRRVIDSSDLRAARA